jgi:hypothetical protein
VSRARNIGSAMRAEAGIWITGMTSKMLVKKMKKNSDSMNGVHARPSLPIVCMMMPSCTKSTADSATFCMPVGTICFLAPRMNTSIVRMMAKK